MVSKQKQENASKFFPKFQFAGVISGKLIHILANPQMKASIVMMCMVIPGQAVFLGVIYALGSGHQELSAIFITLYMFSSLLQVRHVFCPPALTKILLR